MLHKIKKKEKRKKKTEREGQSELDYYMTKN